MNVVHVVALVVAVAPVSGPVRPADALLLAAAKVDPLVRPQQAFDAWTVALAALRAERLLRPAEIANAMRGRADTMLSLSRTKEAIAEAEAALAIAGQGREADIVRAGLFTTLGNGADGQSEWPKARDYHKKAMDLRVKLFGSESLEAAESEADLGLELTKLGSYDQALTALEHSFAVQSRGSANAAPSRLVAGVYLANIYYSRSRRNDSVDLLRRLIADGQPLGPLHPLMAQMVSQLAGSLAAIGRPIDAMAVHRSSIAALQANKTNKAVLGDALMGATMVSLQLDRPAETETLAAGAAQNFEEFGQSLSAAAALSQAANAARQLDRPVLALERAEKAVTISKRIAQPVPMATALFEGTQAAALAANGRVADALELQRKAYDVIAAGRPAGHSQRTFAEIELGWLIALNGDATGGVARLRPVIEGIVRRNRDLEIAQARVVPITPNLESIGQALEAAYLAHDSELGFFLAQVLTESDAGRATLATLAKLSARDPATGTRLDRRRELLGQRIDFDSQRVAKITDPAAVAELSAKIAPIETELATIDAALARDFPGFDKLLRPAPETIASVQQRIAPGEVLLVPVTTYHGFYTFALTRDKVAWGRSPLSRTGARALIERIRVALPFAPPSRGAVAIAPADRPFDRAASAGLYAALFTAEVAALTRRAKLLSIAPDDVMSTIPVSLLVTAPTTKAPWLIDLVALRIVPAIAAIGQPGTRANAGKSFVGIGAPSRGPAAADASPLIKQIAELPALPGALAELRAIGASIGDGHANTVLTGIAATESRLRAVIQKKPSILVFATHGLVSGEFDSLNEPALLLTPDPLVAGPLGDGLLTASEAATLDLDADWIVLSACNTAAGDQLSAAGYSGLARAFLFAGGKQILASHWPVRDDIAARLTVETIRASANGRTGPEALRTAILKLKGDRSVSSAADPGTWAPFMIISR